MTHSKGNSRFGRKLLAMLITVSMLLAMLSGTAAGAASETDDAELEWRYSVDDDGYATITRYLGSDTNIVVPGVINGYEVRTIGTLAFNRNDDIDSISIPSTVTAIESWAFYDLNGLEVLTIGGDLDSVASDAFMSSNASGVEVYTTEATAALLQANVSAMANNTGIYTGDEYMITITVTLQLNSDSTADSEETEDTETDSMGDAADMGGSDMAMGDPPDGMGGGDMGGSSSSVAYTADYGAASAPYASYFAPSSTAKNYAFVYQVLTADGVVIQSITDAALSSDAETSYTGSVTDFTQDVTIAIVLSGTASYDTVTEEATYAEGFSPDETGVSYNKTFRNLTADEAAALNEEISSDSGYSAVAVRIVYSEGYYVNGTAFPLDDDLIAYDVETGVVLYDGTGSTEEVLYDDTADLPDATSDSSAYQYVGYTLNETGDAIAVLYYSPWSLDSTSTSTTVSGIISLLTGEEAPVNGMTGQADVDEVYASFINSVITADGIDIDLASYGFGTLTNGILTLNSTDVGDDGNTILAAANEERSIIYATNGGTITTGAVILNSTATINNAKMSYESGLSSYNEEIGMEWGMTAVAYATSGGHIILGDPTGETTSYITSVGETVNGAIAVTTGSDGGTSIVEVYNTVMDLQGWNSHIADVMYGGYIYLENVTGTNGIEGSFACGQSGSISNDFGNGVVEGDGVTVIAYGNRTAGAYVIGGGIINLTNSSLKCYTDGGAVIASGGTFHISDSTVEGVSGIKIRGSIETENISTFTNVTVIADQDYDEAGYVYGEYADAAVEAWVEYSGSSSLAYWMMSSYGYTMGELCDYYGIDGDARTAFYAALDEILDDDETYTDDTLLRCSVLDNTRYNYSGGTYADTDNHDVPYLTIGPFGGLTQSVILAEAAGAPVELYNCTFINENDSDYNYLISSESASHPYIYFIDSADTVTGIIWNEGTNTNRTADGRSSTGDSYIDVWFQNTDFEGSFADGDNGLWEASISYVDYDGNETTLNGNYYNATANWGITASFDSESSWTVTHDSYIGSLTLEEGAVVAAAEGYTMTVYINVTDGTDVSTGTLLETLTAGTYENVVILLTEDAGNDTTFADDDGTGAWEWASDAIYEIYEAGIISGFEDNTYRPDESLTRAQAAKIIAEAYDLTLSDEAYETFTDDDGSGNWTWASEYIYACVQAGILDGYTDGTFLPDQAVTRAEIAKMIAIAEGISSDAVTSNFSDVSDDHWALTYIEACYENGLVQGIGEGVYGVSNDITRAQMAVLISRIIAD